MRERNAGQTKKLFCPGSNEVSKFQNDANTDRKSKDSQNHIVIGRDIGKHTGIKAKRIVPKINIQCIGIFDQEKKNIKDYKQREHEQ